MKSVPGFWIQTVGVAFLSVSSAIGQCVNNIDCDDGDACTFDRCVDTACSNTAAEYGDVVGPDQTCGPDGVTNILDFIAVFDGFGGVIETSVPGCSLHNVDLGGPGGCVADGSVDLYDILAVRDKFIGIDNCCVSCADAGSCDDAQFCNGVETCDTTCQPGWADNPCAGQRCDESVDACFASFARMTCEVSPQRVQPGGTVTVDLFLQHATGLGGYQAGIDVARLSGSGEAACVGLCASIDPFRFEHVFPSNQLDVVDHDGLRVAGFSLNDTTGVDVGVTRANMGSFELTISEDAAVGSTFEISVSPDQLLLSPGRNVIPYTVGEACVVTVAPADCNDNGIDDVCDLDCGSAGCDVPGCGLSADCNANDSPDECDIAQGLSDDCGGDPACGECMPNGIPSECDARFRMFAVPAGEDPARYADGSTVINAFGRQSETIAMELFVQNSPVPLVAVAGALPCEANGGLRGAITLAEGSASVNEFRDDYIFFQRSAVAAVDDRCNQTELSHFKTASAITEAGSASVCGSKYFFSFDLDISPDAAGVFTFDFITVLENVTGAFGSGNNLEAIPGLALESLVIDLTPPDCDGNGISDHCDLDCGPDGDECNVFGCGEGTDCNGNGVPDRCDIADGTSEDCTGNGVPDECDTDCDGDGVADDCAIAGCGEDVGCVDCDSNGIPDSCDIADCDGDVACDDCNDNSIPDRCDIARGSSLDDNQNNVPDECDPPSGDEPRLFLVPRGGNPEDYALRPSTALSFKPGESRTLQVWTQKSGRPLGAYQVTLDDAVGGESGSVSYVNPMIDQFNPNWVYTGLSGVLPVTDIGPPVRMTAAAPSGAPVVIEPRYCGELTYTASLNACGTFAVDFINPGRVQGESQTLLFDGANNPIEFTSTGALIRVSAKIYGDVNGDGETDVFDILCVLDGFAGRFALCDQSDLDIAPCGGDGAISLDDIVGVLDGFIGVPSPCPMVCP